MLDPNDPAQDVKFIVFQELVCLFAPTSAHRIASAYSVRLHYFTVVKSAWIRKPGGGAPFHSHVCNGTTIICATDMLEALRALTTLRTPGART